jgi:hypothetical protein
MDVTDRTHLIEHHDSLTRECAPLGVRRITYPRRFAALPAVRAAILDDLAIDQDEVANSSGSWSR